MSTPAPVARPTTKFAERLTSKDSAEREKARAELDALGPGAGDVLLQELDGNVQLSRSTSSMTLALLMLTSNVLGLKRDDFERKLFCAFVVCACVFYVVYAVATLPTGLRRRYALVFALAERDDLRVIGPLLEVTSLTPTSRPNPDEERAAAELTRLLARHRTDPNAGTFTGEFRKLVLSRVGARHPQGRLRSALLARAPSAAADYTDTQADLMASLMQVIGGWVDGDARDLLARIADAPADRPNRRFVREAARAFFAPMDTEATPAVATSPTTTAASPIAPALKAGRRP